MDRTSVRCSSSSNRSMTVVATRVCTQKTSPPSCKRLLAEDPRSARQCLSRPSCQWSGSNTGGFKFMVEDRGDLGLQMLQEQTDKLVEMGNKTTGLVGLTTVYNAKSPQIFIDIDREQCPSWASTSASCSAPSRLSECPVREQLQPFRAYVAGHRPGRFPVPEPDRRHRPIASSQ